MRALPHSSCGTLCQAAFPVVVNEEAKAEQAFLLGHNSSTSVYLPKPLSRIYSFPY